MKKKNKKSKLFTKLLREHLRKAKKKWISSRLNKKDPKELWKTIKTLQSNPKSANCKPVYSIDGQLMNTARTCTTLNNYFAHIGGPPSDINIEQLLSSVPACKLEVHPGQVKSWLRQIDTSKATSSSDFPSWVSKSCSEDLCLPICDIINDCLSTGIFPTVWKKSEIVPIEKVKCAQSPSDFRPISLLWNIGKILERAIMYFYSKSVLHTIGSDQFAYQKGKSTCDAILSAVDMWTASLDQKGVHSVPVAFLDMSKAFDRMDKPTLLKILIDRCVSRDLARIIYSFLSNRTQCVKLGNTKSENLYTQNGTPQGTLLGPMFWLAYIDTLTTSASTIKYADDLTISGNNPLSSSVDIQTAIDQTTEWCKQNNMIANAKKSTTLSISNIHNNHVPPPVTFNMDGEKLKSKHYTKFLGIIIDSHLTFSHHVDHIIEKTRPLMYSLIDLKRSQLPKHILKKFYETCIRPMILYACPSWYSMTSQTQKNRVRRVESIALRVIESSADSYKERTAAASITPILTLLDNTSRDYVTKIKQNPSHCLHPLTIPKQTNSTRRSARVAQPTKPWSRTELRSKCPLLHYN